MTDVDVPEPEPALRCPAGDCPTTHVADRAEVSLGLGGPTPQACPDCGHDLTAATP